MSEHRFYSDQADLYDAIYSSKPYEAEAERLHDILAEQGVSDGSRVLEAACGTGRYLEHLCKWYRADGFDREEGMLKVARARIPSARLFSADMESFSVDQPYDAVLCLFSSIAYVHPQLRLEAAAERFAAALPPGGTLMVEPFVAPAQFQEHKAILQTHESDSLKCARACVPRRSGELALLDFHWLVMRRGEAAVTDFVEEHALWLCPHEQLAATFEQAGFAVAMQADGERPLIVARRRA